MNDSDPRGSSTVRSNTRTIGTAMLLLLISACHPKFTTIDEACDDKVRGEDHVSESTSLDAIHRLNCYRRLARVGQAGVDRVVQEVTEDHVNYMMQLPELGSYAPGMEVSENMGFTGGDLYDRLENAYYPDLTLTSWELTPLNWPFNGADNIDYLFPDPWVRQIYLQPLVSGMGLDEGLRQGFDVDNGWSSYITILYAFPDGHGPVVYPVDGQQDVDPSYYDDIQGGALVEYGEVGFPITITMNSGDLALREYALTGPTGEIDVIVHLPGAASWGSSLQSTISVTPRDALQPSTEYVFTARVSESDRTYNLESTFRTASSTARPLPAGYARGTVPAPLITPRPAPFD